MNPFSVLTLVLSWTMGGARSVPNGRKNSVTLRPEVAAVLTRSSVLVWHYWWVPSPNAPPVLFVLAWNRVVLSVHVVLRGVCMCLYRRIRIQCRWIGWRARPTSSKWVDPRPIPRAANVVLWKRHFGPRSECVSSTSAHR